MASKNASRPSGSKGSQKTPRTYLSLEKKVEVINHLQKHLGTSVRALGEIFGCGKTQIAQIVKNKKSILSLYQAKAGQTEFAVYRHRPHGLSDFLKNFQISNTIP